MIKGLVNILTPAYNSGEFIKRLLDSVLCQTYPKIVMYVIDDGSTDNTASVVKSNICKFHKRGYTLHYIYQENQGQSYAINRGLKLLDGEYLFWPDSDDWYSEKNSIELLVNALENSSDDIGIVRCRYQILQLKYDNSYSPLYVTDFEGKTNTRYLLHDAITRNNGFRWEPGGYGIKLKYINNFIPNREIITGQGLGQNAQILLPYFANSKCITIDNVLFNYLIRPNSHSRNAFIGYQKVVARELGHMQLISEILSHFQNLKQWDIKELERLNEIGFRNQLLNIAIEAENSKDIITNISRLRSLNRKISKQENVIYLFSKLFNNPKLAKKLLSLYTKSRY